MTSSEIQVQKNAEQQASSSSSSSTTTAVAANEDDDYKEPGKEDEEVAKISKQLELANLNNSPPPNNNNNNNNKTMGSFDTATFSLSLDAPINMEIPASECNNMSADQIKEWVWKHHQDEIMKALRLERNTTTTTTTTTNATATTKMMIVNDDDANNKSSGEDEEEKNESSLISNKKRRVTGGNGTNARENLLDTIAHVQRQFFQSAKPKVVFGYLLEGLLEMMSSEYGFIGEIKYEEDGTMYLQTHAITNIAWNQATRQFFEDNITNGLKFTNMKTLFGTVMTTQQPVIANDPYSDPRAGGLPEGHPPLNHFLGLPFFYKGKMTGMVGISNKPGGYSEEDIDFLEPLTVTCSNLIQAFQQIKQNDYLINTLEESVKARTKELVQVNLNLEEASRQVRQNAVMQMQHFACMSHEIRTPLNCIIGMSSLLKDTEMSPMQAESMKMIIASGDLLLAIVNDVLDYAKLETDHVEINVMRSDLQDMLQSILYSIEMKAKNKGQSIKAIYSPNLPVLVNTDIRRIQQILFNLLGNAVKFSRDDAIVELLVRYEKVTGDEVHEVDFAPGSPRKLPLEESKILKMPTHEPNHDLNTEEGPPSSCPFHQPTSPSSTEKKAAMTNQEGSPSSCPFQSSNTEETVGKPTDETAEKLFAKQSAPTRRRVTDRRNRTMCNLIFTVKDYGKGIERSEFEAIFRPFQQASGVEMDSVYGGTGLGLAITKKLVTALGGTISVDSEVDAWSEFTVTLPCSDAPAPVDELTKKMSDTTILLVGLPSHQEENVMRIFRAFQMDVRLLDSVDEMSPLLSSDASTAIAMDRRIICLVNGDKYTKTLPSLVSEVRQKSNRCISVFTFGPHVGAPSNHSSTDSSHHIRSLERMIPQALIEMLHESSSRSMTAGDRSDSSDTEIKPPQEEVSYQNLRVLIAEDNKINQKVLCRMLGRLNVDSVDVVENGRLAVEREACTPYDVILMDQQMPVMGGVPACRAIVSRKTGTHPIPFVLFVTAHVSIDFEKECKAAGSSGFLPKPFKLDDIDRTFRELARRLALRNAGGGAGDQDKLYRYRN